MHPDVGDLILGIKRSLMEEILPAVSTPFAREQLAFAALFCDHVAARWDCAHVFITAEFDDLRDTLAAAADIGRRCRTPGRELVSALEATDAALAATHPGNAQPLRTLQRSCAELKGSVVRLLAACDAGLPTDQAARTEIRQALGAYMRRQLGREEEWVSTTPVGWW